MVIAMILVGVSHAAVAVGAGNPDTGPGCGLGKKLWEGWKGQKQIAPQMFMASTNMTGSYSFSIPSGTSGCSHDGRVWDSEKAALFIELNYANLAEDMARGGGEHLASLATLMHVPLENQPQLFASVQERYAFLTTMGEDEPVALRKALQETLSTHPILARLQVSH
ncbi:MAG TPA: DUF3015 family protein [Nitrospiraceae bacterium]|nr:DUF3015 family protein [Nitrospiraceae bacterium]